MLTKTITITGVNVKQSFAFSGVGSGVTAKMEELKIEIHIYDPDLEAKLTAHVKTIMRQLNAIYLKLHQEDQ